MGQTQGTDPGSPERFPRPPHRYGPAGNPDVGRPGRIGAYQRSSRAPASAPAATTRAMARLYQVATNSGESSTQWEA